MKNISIVITIQTDEPDAAAKACRALYKLGFGALIQAEDDPGPQPDDPPPTDPPNG